MKIIRPSTFTQTPKSRSGLTRPVPSKRFFIAVGLFLLLGVLSCESWIIIKEHTTVTNTRNSITSRAVLPDLQAFQSIIAKVKPSVVKVESHGCGVIVAGSGFIVGQDLVATNAHVIAGTHDTHVFDSANGEYSAALVWIDTNTDLAILRADSLVGAPLTDISVSSTPTGEQGVILGYPGGKDFTAKPAVITGNTTAYYDIYGNSMPSRNVYTLNGEIDHGNSGGPLIGAFGNVMGVVFARSTVGGTAVGYAITPRDLRSIIQKARTAVDVVSTGACASEKFDPLVTPPAEGAAPIPLNL